MSKPIGASMESANVEKVKQPVDKKYLLLEGVNESVADETLRLYLMLILNPNLDDNFKIERIRRNHRRCLVKFNQAIKYSEISARQNKVPDLTGSTIVFNEVLTPDTIRVAGLSNNCNREMLDLYFSNTKVSGGGDIKQIKMFEYDNKALIQFCDFTIIDDILAKSHSCVCGPSLKIEKYFGPIEDEYFIEEEQEIGSQSDRNKSLARSGNAYFTIRSFSQPSLIVDRSKIILSNIQENVNIQQLDFYIQLITQQNRADINEINWSLEKKGKLIIDFKTEIDINKILSEFNNSNLNNINGKPIQIETVNKSKTLVALVKASKKNPSKEEEQNDAYIPESIPATKDLITLYFHNKQRSGGGEIESIERKTSRYWFVVVKDYRVMKDILTREHIIDKKPIKLFPYYENFGLPYLFRPIFDDHTTYAGMNTTFKMKIRDDRLKNFSRVLKLHKRMNEILTETNAIARFNKGESNLIYVNYIEKLVTKVPYSERIWRLKVMESLEYFLRIYKYEKITLSSNQWTTITKTKQLNEAFFDSYKVNDELDEDTRSLAATSSINNDIRYISSTCAIISVNETSTNVEIAIVGENTEVDNFIVKIKDVICKAYFTFELEEKIIKFKTYLNECEELLSKWLNAAAEEDIDIDSDKMSESGQNSALKLTKSRRHTIDEFLSKLEQDLLDMELSYGKLFQGLGYDFLSHTVNDEFEEDDSEYKEFNSRLSSSLDEVSTIVKLDNKKESQMDKVRYTLNDLRARINGMRKKFRQYTIKINRGNQLTRSNSNYTSDDGEGVDFDEDEEKNAKIKLCVYLEEENRILTVYVSRSLKIRTLKRILLEKMPSEYLQIDSLILYFNEIELEDDYTLADYNIEDTSTIKLQYDNI